MGQQMRAYAYKPSGSTVAPTPTALLQRRCACGGTPGPDGECAACKAKRLQRQAATQAGPAVAPPIVGDVLASPGQPLDAATRSFMEPRFGHSFDQVRVHTDAQAADSARAVDALAYTVGRDVVFGVGQYAPTSSEGRRLLAHELAHTIQQRHDAALPHDRVQVSQPSDRSEVEAEIVSAAITQGGSHQPVQHAPTRVARQPLPSGTGATPGSQTTTAKASAQRQHEFQQKRVAALIQQGLAIRPTSVSTTDTDTLFRNSCQWIAARQSSLVVLTPTHDSTTRRPQFKAYFDRQVEYPAIGGKYAEQPSPEDTDHIIYTAMLGQVGGMQANEFTLVDPAAQSDDELKATFIHEVQHAADQTFWGRDPNPPPGRASGSPGLTGSDALISAGLYTQYQTEFRAYWLDTPEGSPQNKFGSSNNPAANAQSVTWRSPDLNQTLSVKTNFKNERQEKIFWYLLNNYQGLEIPKTYTTDSSYQHMIDAFDQPLGVNLVNSLRIQALSDALKQCKPSQDAAAPDIRAMFTKVDALDASDLAFLNDRRSSQIFWKQAIGALSLQMFLELQRKIIQRPVGDFPFDPAWQLPSDQAPV